MNAICWKEIMRPVSVSDTAILESVSRSLGGAVTFRLNGEKIVWDFQRSEGVPYRFRREGDLVHVERRVRDLVPVLRRVDRCAMLLKKTVERP